MSPKAPVDNDELVGTKAASLTANQPTQTDGSVGAVGRNDTRFLGHPIGLAWLSAAEFWERFSYFGMQALLVLYMSEHLFKPEVAARVWLYEPFRRLIEMTYGPTTDAALPSITFGLYGGLVYVTPLAGGWLADRVLGRTWTVTLGGLLMALGHFLMAFDVSFFVALICLLLGAGCFKGNLAGQIGDLYPPNDPRRPGAFQVYFFGIQIAVILSPFVCGTLGEVFGWHLGFGLAGIGMVIGLAIYLFGRASLPPEPFRAAASGTAKAPLTPDERRSVLILVALLPVLALALVGHQQVFNAYLIWAKRAYDFSLMGHQIPVTWLLSLNATMSALLIAASAFLWRWYGRRRPEPEDLTKMIVGVIFCALAPVVLAAASAVQAMGGARIPLGWAIAFHFLGEIGFANLLPVGLALYSRAAPQRLSGVMIAVYYLHMFLGTVLTGYLGTYVGALSDVKFWALHAGLIGIAAILLLFARVLIGKRLSSNSPGPVAQPATSVPASG